MSDYLDHDGWKDPGGPAFPIHPGLPAALGATPCQSDAGMSVRDYFAAAALPEVLRAMNFYDSNTTTEDVAEMAYRIADAMLYWRTP